MRIPTEGAAAGVYALGLYTPCMYPEAAQNGTCSPDAERQYLLTVRSIYKGPTGLPPMPQPLYILQGGEALRVDPSPH